MTKRKDDRVHQILHQTFSVLDEAIAEQRLLRGAGQDDEQRKKESTPPGRRAEGTGRKRHRSLVTEKP